MSGVLIKRSVSLDGHRTSVALEVEFWEALDAVASAERVSCQRLIARIDAERGDRPLASALRVHALQRHRTQSRA
jgi:predicted DNA-binding ribbon-helix-helix protein